MIDAQRDIPLVTFKSKAGGWLPLTDRGVSGVHEAAEYCGDTRILHRDSRMRGFVGVAELLTVPLVAETKTACVWCGRCGTMSNPTNSLVPSQPRMYRPLPNAQMAGAR